MNDKFDNKIKKSYRYIYIIDSIENWKNNNYNYDINCDLILTYDFELKLSISKLGGNSFFLDHLCDQKYMQKNNFIIYNYFKNWHFDENGDDIFIYKDIPFGFSLRLEFWNDYVSYCRLFLNLAVFKYINYDKIFVDSSDENIFNILNEMKTTFTKLDNDSNLSQGFYFPITKWLDSKIRPIGLRGVLYRIRSFVNYLTGTIMLYLDKNFRKKNVKTVFIQEYHPTKKILSRLRDSKKTNVLLVNYSRGIKIKDNLKERVLPIKNELSKYENTSNELISKFEKRKINKLVLDDIDITDQINKLIMHTIKEGLDNNINTLNNCINYLNKNNVNLEILIANIGHHATLFDMVCRVKKIPSYLIINGLLCSDYSDDSRYATYINSYSESIKGNYFRNKNNVHILGDPRMDDYYKNTKNIINREFPTITIGASGFNSTNLSSYLAAEFDFLNDILSTIQNISKEGQYLKINIKVRPNGYKKQYIDFVNKFFPNLNISVEDVISMKEILKRTDFYITVYSQSLFEASILGIPVIYYKKDTEILNPPFDAKSELVTVRNQKDLKEAFYDFQNKHERYDAFLDRKVMEKYIGPLDGKNLERNLDFIHKLLSENKND